MENRPLRRDAEQLAELAHYLSDRLDATGLELPLKFTLPDMGTVEVSVGTGTESRRVELVFDKA